MDKLKQYLKNIDEIVSLTIDPDGPGAIRIHLVPPRKIVFGIPWTIIINGYHMLPINTSWAILIHEFILEVHKQGKNVFSNKDRELVDNNVIARMIELFPRAERKTIKSDLDDILDTLFDIAKGKEPNLYIGYMPLSKAARYLKAPHRVDLMISSLRVDGMWNCNQNCKLCYAAKGVEATSDEIDTNSWKQIIDNLHKSGVSQLTFTGGEPTLRDDLVELVSYSKWFVTRLNTNGVKLTSSLCKDLYEASLDSVQITLYSANKNIHNILVGKDNYDATIEGIKNALNANLNVSVNTPLCSLNKDYVETIKFLHQLGISYFTCSGVIETGNATNAKDEYLTRDELYELLKQATDYCYQNNLEIDFTSPGQIDDERLKELKLTIPSCGACLSNMAIAPNGDVLSCQSSLDDNLGNVLKESLSSIYKSSKCRKIRNRSAKDEHKCYLSSMEEI